MDNCPSHEYLRNLRLAKLEELGQFPCDVCDKALFTEEIFYSIDGGMYCKICVISLAEEMGEW